VSLGIRNRLFMSFGVMLVLMGLVGVVGWNYTRALEASYQEQYRSGVLGGVYLGNAQNALWELRYSTPQYLVLGDEAKKKIVEDEQNRKWYKVLEENMAAYKATIRTPEQQRAMQDWEQIYTSYRGIRPHWYELQAAGKTQEAAEYRAGYMTPGGSATTAALQRLIDLQRAQANEAQQAVQAEARAAQIRQLGSLGLALVIGLVVSLFVARSIVKPLLQMADAAQRLAEGDINQEVTVRSRDEIGQLGSAFNTMIAYQQQMADAADKISQGNLAVDVEPKSPKDVLGHAFQRMTTNLRRMAAAADAISRGDLRAGRVVDLMPQSGDDVFGHAFQRLVAQMRRLQARERDGAGDRPLTADRR